MKINFLTIGKTKHKSPELDIINDYIKRADNIGRGLGFSNVNIFEGEVKQKVDIASHKQLEADLLLSKVSKKDYIIICDETGQNITSRDFAALLSNIQQESYQNCNIMIGGANGFSLEIKDIAHKKISFGKMTWPHMLVRVMLSEQIYRAMTILSGHPYHKD